MAKSVTDKMRLRFPHGGQKIFLERCTKKLGLTGSQIAVLLGISVRTFTDWKREKFLVSMSKARLLSRQSKVSIPRSAKMERQFWYVTKGAQKGGVSVFKKYGRIGGDPEIRKARWFEWWERKGKFLSHPIFRPFSFRKPKRSIALAELMGILMGDGGITKRQITITLHHKDDLLYSKFVIRLMKELFGVKPSVYHIAKFSVNNIVISRTGLVQYLHALGLPIGNKVKQQFDIPQWIKNNKEFRKACVRGLVDTDGSVFTHRYKVGGKWYGYKKLAFTSASQPLLKSVHDILTELGLRVRRAQQGRDIRIDSIEEMKKYFRLVGSHNQKHLKRYLE